MLNVFLPAPDISGCKNVSCPSNSSCLIIDGEASCVCAWPYVETENDTAANQSADSTNSTSSCNSEWS